MGLTHTWASTDPPGAALLTAPWGVVLAPSLLQAYSPRAAAGPRIPHATPLMSVGNRSDCLAVPALISHEIFFKHKWQLFYIAPNSKGSEPSELPNSKQNPNNLSSDTAH